MGRNKTRKPKMNNKLFLSVATMIVTGFAIKTWRKMHQKPLTREETYRLMKAEAERRNRRDFVQGLGKVKEEVPRPFSPDKMDAMALRPRMDMATASNFEPAIGSCAR
jgi:hypothetical protein